jgi:hypothetical protein
MSDVLTISTIVAETGVDALISVDPIIPIMDKSVAKDYEQKTYQTGDTVYIRLEDQPALPRQSADIALDPITQDQIAVQVLQWNTAFQLSSLERDYYLGGESRVRNKVVKPRAETMATQAALICYNEICSCPGYFTPASGGIPGITALKTATDWSYGQAALNDQLANNTGLYAIMSNITMAETSGDLAKAFNPSNESATAFMKGRVKEAMNLNFFQTANLPIHLNGSQAGSTNGSSGLKVSTNVTSGATTVAVSGGTGTNTITANSLIWFWNGTTGGLSEIQPHTKNPLARIRTFNVVSDLALSGGAGTLTVYPPIYGPENKKLQNISALPTTANYVGIVGNASTAYEQAVVMKKGASSFIGLSLPDLAAQDVVTRDYEGVEVKVTSGSDIRGYQNITRMDMLVAAKNRQWRHMYRAFTRAL